MTADGATLAVELLTEELPPRALKSLGIAFADSLYNDLAKMGFHHHGIEDREWFASPRRIAVTIRNVRAVAPDSEIIEKLMPAKVALDAAGQPSQALQKRLAALGAAHLALSTPSPNAVDGAQRMYMHNDGKGDYVYLRSLRKGQTLAAGLQRALDDAIARLPIPKVMSYARQGSYYNDVKFVRPAHRLLALHGADVVPVTALGLDAGRITEGHRFAGVRMITVATADAWEEALAAEGKVLASFSGRREKIATDLAKAAHGASIIMDDALLDEVTALVEWPAVYQGTFDPEFLAVPQECLILTMRQNQKYFALADAEGKLLDRFLLVSNIETTHPAAIVQGNERVLRARLADARFFYDQDRKLRLESRVPKLAAVVYHSKLGTQLQRVERIRGLAGEIAGMIGAQVDRAAVERAAWLAKADLVTDMVGEFPELQGLMGHYYAEHDGEPHEIAAAIEQHYWPRFAGDKLPQRPVAQAVALADKLDALTGLFAIGQIPTGDSDPLGLRRAGLGLLRILIERHLSLSLPQCVNRAAAWLESDIPHERWVPAFRAELTAAGQAPPAISITKVKVSTEARTQLLDFLYDRLRGYLRDLGFDANAIAAVVDCRPEVVDDIPSRLEAVRAFETLPEAAALAAANKRIINILRKSGTVAAPAVDRSLLGEGAERDLYHVFEKLQPMVEAHCEVADYTSALMALATAKPAVDQFFDDVMVMTDDPAIRANRLALLRGVAQTMNRVADISKLAS